MSFDRLPQELKFTILNWLTDEIHPLLQFGQTSRELRLLSEDEILWFNIFQQRYPQYILDRMKPIQSSWKLSVLNSPIGLGHCTDNKTLTCEITSMSCYGQYNYYELKLKGPITLELPICRSQEKLDTVLIDKLTISEFDIGMTVNEYYSAELTLQQLLNYQATVPDWYDLLHHAIAKSKRGQRVIYEDIMCGLYYEGLIYIAPRRYRVRLRSE